MRTLVLLRGSAGVGKSYWVHENNLEQYTINVDNVRMMFQSPVMQIDGSTAISQKNDHKVWDFVRELVRQRMERGETTIIDATHSRSSLVNDWKRLCQEFRYRCVVVEFPNDLELVLERNNSRPVHKIVPEEVVKNMVERIRTQPTPNWCKTMTPEQFISEFKEIEIYDFNRYDKIVHFGDIHGCYEPLKEYFDTNPFDENTMYVFLGDYTDRGIQNKEVLEFLMPLSHKKNVLFLEGNHESWLRMYANDDVEDIRSREFLNYTMKEIESLDKKDIREFTRRLGQFALYNYDGNVYFVCHGGLPKLPDMFTATIELIKGVGKYEDYLEVCDSWNKWSEENGNKYYQIFGHRNTTNTPILFGNTFNLCDRVEFGGDLRILTLEHGKPAVETLIKNNVYYINEMPEQKVFIDTENILDMLLQNKDIRVKHLKDNVVSINFTREVFYKKRWNELTKVARGLFVNKNTKEIVARSFKKFFNFEESDYYKTDSLRRKMKFPAKAYLKYNGYLGIVGYNSEVDKLFVATKSTNTGDMQKVFYKLLQETGKMDEIEKVCKEYGQSMIFEVIDPINDPHIIPSEKQEIVLLDVIDRSWDFNRSLDVKNVGKELGLKVKELAYEFENYNEFFKFTEDVSKEGYTYKDKYVEGFVVEDSAGMMIKFKTDFYKTWKFARNMKDTLQAGRVFNTAWLNRAIHNTIYAWISHYDKDELQEKSIIDIQREFYEQSQASIN